MLSGLINTLVSGSAVLKTFPQTHFPLHLEDASCLSMIILCPLEGCEEKLLKANTCAALLLMVNGTDGGLIICENDLFDLAVYDEVEPRYHKVTC